jgi:vitamin B12 transporter
MKIYKNTAKVFLLFSASSLLHPNHSLAQQQTADTDDVIFVTVNRRPQPLSQVGSSVSVLTGDELEQNQQSFMIDALEAIPGVAISQNGSFGGNASISIRGAGGDRTVMLVDGIQLNDASSTGGAYNFGTLDTYNIERVEILRGPQSTLYGSDAIGGVINIVTKSGDDDIGGKIFLEGGSFNTVRGGAGIYGGDGKLGYNLSASGFYTDGISSADENDGNTERDGLESYNIYGKVTGNLSEIFQLEAMSRYSDNRAKFDSFGPIDGDEISLVDEFSFALRGHLDLLDGRLSNIISGEYSEIDRKNISSGLQTFETTGKRVNFDYLGVFEVSSDVTASGGLQHETTKSVQASDESFDLTSVFGELAFSGIDGLVITGGARYDDHKTFGDRTTFRVTGSYEFAQTGTGLIANWGEGFKAPSINQLTFICTFCGATEPNTNLKPEIARGYEIGVEQPIFEDRITLAATYFHLRIDDAIDFDTAQGGYVNLAKTKSSGVELRINAQIMDNVNISANYTFTDAIDLIGNTRLPREPRNRFSGHVDWQVTDQLNAIVTVTHNGDEAQNEFSPVPLLDGWTRVDFKLSYEIIDDLSIYGRVDNILNEEYQHVPGYGTPDRSFFAGIRKNF